MKPDETLLRLCRKAIAFPMGGRPDRNRLAELCESYRGACKLSEGRIEKRNRHWTHIAIRYQADLRSLLGRIHRDAREQYQTIHALYNESGSKKSRNKKHRARK